MVKRKVIIIGAAGRDFHNFNTYYRDNETYQVVGFTAAQIPGIEGRDIPRRCPVIFTQKEFLSMLRKIYRSSSGN